MARIGDIMRRGVVTCAPDETVSQAASRMAREGVGTAFVREGDEVTGVFSERDLVSRVVAECLDPATTPVSEVATNVIKAVTVDDEVIACAGHFEWQHLRHLAVLEDGEVAGVVSIRDVLSALLDGG